MYNHQANANHLWYEARNDTPGGVGPPIEPPTGNVRQYFLDWLARDGFPFWPFWENIRSWWAIRDLPNVLLLHFADLKTDMPAEIRRIAAFLDIAIDESRWEAIVAHLPFTSLTPNTPATVPPGRAFLAAGAPTSWH